MPWRHARSPQSCPLRTHLLSHPPVLGWKSSYACYVEPCHWEIWSWNKPSHPWIRSSLCFYHSPLLTQDQQRVHLWPWCGDQIVWFVWSNGSYSNSLTQEPIYCTTCSSFLIELDEPSACCAFQSLLRSACWWTDLLTRLTLFTFRVLDRSCSESPANQTSVWIPLFIVDSIHVSRATHEYGFPVIDCANILSSIKCSLFSRKGIKLCNESGRWHRCHRLYLSCLGALPRRRSRYQIHRTERRSSTTQSQDVNHYNMCSGQM